MHGVSTRKGDDLVQALGLQAGISKSEVSRICSELDESLEAFRTRSLAHVAFPYVFLDATYLKGRVGSSVAARVVVVAMGVTIGGERDVLGLAVGDRVLSELRDRGPKGVRSGLPSACSQIRSGAVSRPVSGRNRGRTLSSDRTTSACSRGSTACCRCG